MNPLLLEALAAAHAEELRRHAARSPVRARRPRSRPAARSAWRRRTGFALVEAGLHLLATTGPQPRP
jgi:hypothetical protein